MDLEYGCWHIVTSTETYEPINLAEEFKVEGLRVTFEAKLREDLTTVCPGVLIELLQIQRLE